jgi:hypothetical protein
MEMGIAVISGNLPLLPPLFEHFFRISGSSSASKGSKFSNSYSHSGNAVLSSKSRGLSSKVDTFGFQQISEDGSPTPPQANSDIELGDQYLHGGYEIAVT